MEQKKQLKLALPKGSLEEATIKLFEKAGYNIKLAERSYYPKIDDPEIDCVLVRGQEIPRYVAEGIIDCGFSGEDWVLESKAEVVEVANLDYTKNKIGKAKWVLAVSENSNIKSVKDLQGKIVSTELVEISKDYFRKHKVMADIRFSWGATEMKPPRFADAIIEIIDTGTTLKTHNLKIIDVIMESATKFIANKKSWKDNWKKEKIKNLAMLLTGALAAEDRVGVMMHVLAKNLKKAVKLLPAMKKPTITKIIGENYYDLLTVAGKREIRKLIPKLKKIGCTGIVEFPLNRIVK